MEQETTAHYVFTAGGRELIFYSDVQVSCQNALQQRLQDGSCEVTMSTPVPANRLIKFLLSITLCFSFCSTFNKVTTFFVGLQMGG